MQATPEYNMPKKKSSVDEASLESFPASDPPAWTSDPKRQNAASEEKSPTERKPWKQIWQRLSREVREILNTTRH